MRTWRTEVGPFKHETLPFPRTGGACTWMFRPRSDASDYFAVCSFRFGAAPAAPAGLAALLNGGIWLMDLK